MPCPICGAEDVTPLTLKRFDGLVGAVKTCEECNAVFLVADEARLPASLLQKQIAGWKAVRAVIGDVVDALVDHPVTREFFARDDCEIDVWRRDAIDAMERAVSALVPTLRQLAD